jgi:hypothetical protein
MMRTFYLDLPLCREASNYSNLHPFGRLSSTSGCRPVFDQLWISFQKHIYGKTAATVWMMCILIQTHSFIRQVVHSKSRRIHVSLHGPDAQASYMKIVCIKSTVWTTDVMVWTCQALIWKLRATKVQLFGH